MRRGICDLRGHIERRSSVPAYEKVVERVWTAIAGDIDYEGVFAWSQLDRLEELLIGNIMCGYG